MSSSTLSASVKITTPVIVQSPSLGADYLGCDSPHPVFDAVLERHTQQASLKLRFLIGVKGYRNKVKVYLLISPESVQHLHLERNNTPGTVRDAFVRSSSCASVEGVVRLHISLTQSLMILGPADIDALEPKTASSGRLLDAFRALTRANSLLFYLPVAHAPPNLLETLCADLNCGTYHLLDGELESLYRGKGAKVIGHQSAAVDSPPSYDELALSPPPALPYQSPQRAPSGKKRRRSIDTADLRNNHRRVASEERLDALNKQIKEVAEHVGADKPDGLAAQISSLQVQFSSMEERILKNLEDNLTYKFETRLAETRDHLLEHIEQRLYEVREEMGDEWHTKLEDAKDEIDEVLQVRLEDQLLDAKAELLDFVKEELETVEDTIKADLRHALQ